MSLSLYILSLLGYTGAFLFYGRFYLQWLVSEVRRESVMPRAFWYMSMAGSVFLLLYGVFVLNSPLGALSHCFNSVIYARNMVHIWRREGNLSKRQSLLFQSTVAVFVGIGSLLVLYTLFKEYDASKEEALSVQLTNWLWIAVGVFGQALFALRFFIQWIVTEIRKESVIPASFWYLSVAASLLMICSHGQRHEWLYTVGIASTLLVYFRNIYWIRRGAVPPSSE